MQVCAPELQELHRNKPDQADDIAAEAADAAAWDDAVSSCPVAAIVEIVDDAAPETENNLAADNTDFAVVAADTAEDMAALVAVTDTAAGNIVPAVAADIAVPEAADSVLCTADAPREVLQSFLYSDHLSHYGQVVRFCISRTCCRSFRILQ